MPSQVYIAGAGVSPLPSGSGGNKVTTALISAATKALLDAGVTYDDVARGVRGKKSQHAAKAFEAFDEAGIEVDEVENESALDSAYALVDKKNASCVLMVVEEESDAVAFVLVSEDFLWSRAYLKDSAALISKDGYSQGKSKQQSLHDLCKTVWALRGWSDKESSGGKEEKKSWQSFELSRADGKAVPKWKEVEHRQDGKHRLGYNPAREMKDISRYLFEGVRAEGKKKNKASDDIQFERKGGDRTALAKL